MPASPQQRFPLVYARPLAQGLGRGGNRGAMGGGGGQRTAGISLSFFTKHSRRSFT